MLLENLLFLPRAIWVEERNKDHKQKSTKLVLLQLQPLQSQHLKHLGLCRGTLVGVHHQDASQKSESNLQSTRIMENGLFGKLRVK